MITSLEKAKKYKVQTHKHQTL